MGGIMTNMAKMTRKILTMSLLTLTLLWVYPTVVEARVGDMSFFGGISEGRRLPRTTEQMLAAQNNRRNNANQTINLRYSEMVFLGGVPQQFDGLLNVRTTGNARNHPDVSEENLGTFNITHTISPGGNGGNEDVTISRSVQFRVNWRREGDQVVLDKEALPGNWNETIIVDDTTFVLNPSLSHYNVSILQHNTPGINFYRGDVSGRLVYYAEGETVTKYLSGSFYGYASAWSSTETHRIEATIIRDEWAMQLQVRPSITANKVLQFMSNEVTPISFDGNYREVFQNNVGLRYDIFVMPHHLWELPTWGTASISTPNTFEQLPAPNLTWLRGNAAEDDIRRLYSTQVLTGDPRFFQPDQAISRGQFVAAIVRAIRLAPEEPAPIPRGRNAAPVTSVFSDVNRDRPEYGYIMAAYTSGLARGRASGRFYFDYPIDRQEAFMLIIRALGLQQLGINPTPVTAFTDDAMIAPWSRRYVSVAQQIGIAHADENGMFHPERLISNAEAASLLNELIDYMRVGLISDYSDQIVNIVR